MRRLYQNHMSDSEGAQSIEKGGTGATTLPQGAKNLGLVTRDMANKPNGVLLLNSLGALDKNALPGSVSDPSNPTLYGGDVVTVNQTLTLKITNYDSFVDYTVNAVGGTAVVKGEDVIFTAGNVATAGSITVNGKTHAIEITAAYVIKPSLISPAQGDQVTTASFVLQSSAFAYVGPTEVHTHSNWQVSSAEDFSTLLVNDAVASPYLTSHQVTLAVNNAVCYARVRHEGQDNGYSQWSDPISFTMAIPMDPYPTGEIYQILDTATGATATDAFSTSFAVDSSKTALVVGAPTATISGAQLGAVSSWSLGTSSAAKGPYFTQAMPGTSMAVTVPTGGEVTFTSSEDATLNTVLTANGTFTLGDGYSNLTISGYGAKGSSVMTDPGQAYVPPSYSWERTSNTFMGNYPTPAYGSNSSPTTSPTAAGQVQDVYYAVSVGDGTYDRWHAVFQSYMSVSGQPYVPPTYSNTTGTSSEVVTPQGTKTLAGSTGSVTQTTVTIDYRTSITANKVGQSVSLSADGNFMAVGSPEFTKDTYTSNGRVSIYAKVSGAWKFQKLIDPSVSANATKFGSKVLLNADGSVLAIASGSGVANCVEIYTRFGTTWTFSTKLTSGDAAAYLADGGQKAMAFGPDNTLYVGCTSKNSNQGAVYGYSLSNGTYALSKTIAPVSTGGQFGYSVAVSNDGSTLVVGEPASVSGSNTGVVKAHVLVNGIWTLKSTLTPTDTVAIGSFGKTVAVSANGKVILGTSFSNGSVTNSGKGFVFRFEGNTWVQKTVLKGATVAQNDNFGYDLALTNDGLTAFIGAPGPAVSNGKPRIYVFQ